ncbi:MAG: sigma-70 family RNA polymerase sigma factor, partial [Asticcacaulis sp.]
PPPADNIVDHGDSLADNAATGEDIYLKKREAQRIQNALSALPAQQKLAIVLCYYEDFTQSEAARIMQVHIKALEGLLSRAKKSLKQDLSPAPLSPNRSGLSS